jgi:putative nucleotidyltransferase with HDIG domain
MRGEVMKKSIRTRLHKVNKELWIVLTMLAIAAALNYVVTSDRMILGFYFLPTVLSGYFYGRRHATLTALGSILLVVLVAYSNPRLFTGKPSIKFLDRQWDDVAIWAGTLVITAYAIGTLYEHKEAKLRELRKTYHGILIILRQFVSKDQYTRDHSYRVSVYASKIAAYVGLDEERIEDVRAASLLHDIGKLEISRELLYKAARLTEGEYKQIQKHVERGIEFMEPVGGSLRRVIPIILAHHDKFDGSGYHPSQGEEIPLEARIITVADVYDAMASDRPYRKGMSPLDVRDAIVKGSGKDFDPEVVDAFLQAFRNGEMEIPAIYP